HRQAGLVVEEQADRDRLLARLGELGPVAGDGGVEVEQAARDEDVAAKGGSALGAGPDQADRVALPRPARRTIGEAAPQIDDNFPIDSHADGRADLAALLEIALELRADGGE